MVHRSSSRVRPETLDARHLSEPQTCEGGPLPFSYCPPLSPKHTPAKLEAREEDRGRRPPAPIVRRRDTVGAAGLLADAGGRGGSEAAGERGGASRNQSHSRTRSQRGATNSSRATAHTSPVVPDASSAPAGRVPGGSPIPT